MKGAIEFRHPKPERAWDLHRPRDDSIFRAGGLKMRAAGIPSDDILHVALLYEIRASHG
jgi:hypothetical protein